MNKYYILLSILLQVMTSFGSSVSTLEKYQEERDTVLISVKRLSEQEVLLPTNMSLGIGDRNDIYRGGGEEGFAESCLPPEILEHGQKEFKCIEDTIVMWVKASGVGIFYKWQKYDVHHFVDLDEKKDSVRGSNTPRMVLFAPAKTRDDGIYRCLITNDCGVVASDTFHVTLSDIPVFASSLSESMTWECIGAAGRNLAVVMDALDPKSLSYTWWRYDTVTDMRMILDPQRYNTSAITLMPKSREDEGIYGVEVSNECGSVSDSAYMTVYMPITVEFLNVENKEIVTCKGENVDFQIKVAGGGVYQYALKKVELISNNPLKYTILETVGEGMSRITMKNVTMDKAGQYIWEVKNNCGSDTSEIFDLVVHELPTYEGGYQFPDTLACEGSELILSCSAIGVGIEYDWFHNGESTGITSEQFIIDTLRKEDAGIYTCFARNVCNQGVPSRAILVTMNPLPEIIRQPMLFEPACLGQDSVEMDVQVGKIQIDSFRWYLNSKPLFDETDKVKDSDTKHLTVYNLDYDKIGLYHVNLYNACGHVSSEFVQLDIHEPARIVKGLAGNELLLCAGKNNKLQISAEGTEPIRYIWLCNEKPIAESEENFVYVKTEDIDIDAEYVVHVENMCGGESSVMTLNVAKIEPLKLEGGGDFCEGKDAIDDFRLIRSDSNILYTLYKEVGVKITEKQGNGDTLNFEGIKLESGRYYVEGKDTNGCIQPMENNIDILLKMAPDDFRLMLLNESCQNNDGANVLMTHWQNNVKYTLLAKNGTEDWIFNSMFIGGNIYSPGLGERKIWENLGDGRYKVEALNLHNGCTREVELADSVALRIPPRLYKLLATDADYINCSLESNLTELEADAYEKGFSYKLLKNGEQFGQILNYSPIRWSHIDEGEYQLVVENEWGCKSESKLVEILNIQSPLQIALGGDGAICSGDVSVFKELILTKSEAGATYKIYQDFPERFIEEVIGTGEDMTVLLPKTNGTYVVDAYDRTGFCKIRLEDNFLVGASDFQAVASPAEVYVDRGVRTRMHVSVDGIYAQPLDIDWQPHNMIEWGVVESPKVQWHRQYHSGFCPCGCKHPSLPGRDETYYQHQFSHGSHCSENPMKCPYLYHAWTASNYGCEYYKTEYVLYNGKMDPYYDLYYCEEAFVDEYQDNTEENDLASPFKDPLTVPVYNDIVYTVTAKDALGCEQKDSVKVRVTGKKLEAEIITSKIHKHYYVPFCPCGDCGGKRHWRHGPGCNENTCWKFYHNHKHEGCDFQKTFMINYLGNTVKHYDLYYCCTGIEAADTVVYRHDELFFCSEVSGGDYNFKYTWSYVHADGEATVFPAGGEKVKFKARESGYLYLSITSMGQHRKDSIWIEVLRRPLKAEIRDDVTDLRVDSVSLCVGERVKLHGWTQGGDNENTILKWFEKENDLGSSSHIIVKNTESHYIWFLASNDGVEVLDSVYILVSPSPEKVEIDNPGVRCVELEQEELIRIPKTQPGVDYVLEYRPVDAPNREYGQRYVDATGGAYAFYVENPVRDAGMYKVRVDTVIGDKVCSIYLDSIEFIPPPPDAQLVDTTYCFGDNGLAIQLKSVEDNILYSILSAKGTVLETISKPVTQFKNLFQAETYGLQSERLGELGSCKKQREVKISRASAPDVSLEVVANAHGPICEGSEITITVKRTEKEITYELVAPDGRVIDSFIGTGGDVAFSAFPRPAGLYMIRAINEDCSIYLDQNIRVNALPKNIGVEDIHYCFVSPQVAASVTVPIEMKYLKDQIRYYLNDETSILDSVDGPGTKSFSKEVSEGRYELLAKDLRTQCVSPIEYLNVVADAGPYPFKLQGGCGASQEITMASSQLSVTYKLLRDAVVINTVVGTGEKFSFGIHSLSGIYTVSAENDTTGCVAEMDGEVAIYELGTCKLDVVGDICTKGGDSRVSLHYACSKTGWSYYIMKVSGGIKFKSLVQPGTGGELWWDKIEGRILREGVYELWAVNSCEEILVETVQVEKKMAPTGRIRAIDAACRDKEVEVVVEGGSSEFKYSLHALVEGYDAPLNERVGESTAFSMGKYTNFSLYRLKASYLDGSCEGIISAARVSQLATPEKLNMIGADACLTLTEEGVVGGVSLCLPARENGVDYYLYSQDSESKVIDHIIGEDTRTCFHTQMDAGCYYTIGIHAKTKCEATMDGLFCLGGLPTFSSFYVDDLVEHEKTEIDMCIGKSCTLILDKSDKGVRYRLYRDDHILVGKPFMGTGSSLIFTNIKEAGVYKVMAVNACDSVEMKNRITVRVGDLPDLKIEDPYYYCADVKGAEIKVEKTERGSVFVLYESKNNRLTPLDTVVSKASASTIVFDVLGENTKDYLIEVNTRYGCKKDYTFTVKEHPIPKSDFNLTSKTSVMCEEECSILTLSGSEKGVSYFLYNELGKEKGYLLGDGKSLDFEDICEEGTYRVEAVYQTAPYCQVGIDAFVKLEVLDSIHALTVEVNRNFYCFGNESKATITLAKGQKNVIYELFRNGLATGVSIRSNADGSKIVFPEVVGGTCEEPNVYTVLAYKGICSKFMKNSVTIAAEYPIDLSTIIFTPERNMEYCEGETIAFKVLAEGCNLTYEWYHNSVKLSETKGYLILSDIKAEQAGVYSCEISNSCKPATEVGRVSARVKEKPLIVNNIKDISFCEGENALVAASTDHVHTGDFRWFKTGQVKDSVLSVAYFLEFDSITREDAGQYVCEGGNSCGVLRDTFMVYVDLSVEAMNLERIVDTLCVGSIFGAYAPIEGLVPFENILWKCNGVETETNGYRFSIPKVASSDEGIYSISVNNACGEQDITVKQLLVDETIKVLDLTKTRMSCVNAPLDLYIITDPKARVEYHWYDGETSIGEGANINVIVGLETTEQTYRVYYSNKCGINHSDVHISIAGTIEIIHPPKELILCAETTKEAVLKADVLGVQVYSYQWYYQAKTSQEQIALGRTSTQKIQASTNKTGFYWCTIDTECEKISTNQTWVKVDSVPSLVGLPKKDTLCINGTYEYEVSGSGGLGLVYDWSIEFKDGKLKPLGKTLGKDFYSTSKMSFGPITEEYNDATLICAVANTCGGAVLKMLISVDRAREIDITPLDTTVCEGKSAPIRIELKNGTTPWTYTYIHESGTRYPRNVKETLVDYPEIKQYGKYTVVFISDGKKCNYVEGNLDFVVKSRPSPVAKIEVVGNDTLCPGEKAQVRVLINYPTMPGVIFNGPWVVSFMREDGSPANLEMGIPDPYTIYRTDQTNPTVIADFPSFLLTETMTYYISTIKDMSGGGTDLCEIGGTDSAAFHLLEQENVTFDFRSEREIFGYCNWALLDTLLNPNINGVPYRDGKFYIDGVHSQLGIFNKPALEPGEHTIRYETSGKCPITNNSVKLWIMPQAKLFVDPQEVTLCPAGKTEINFTAIGSGPFQFEHRRTNINRSGEFSVESIGFTALPKAVPVSHINLSDSLVILEPVLVKDKYECGVDRLDTLKAIVRLLKYPEFKLDARQSTYDEGKWADWRNEYVISKGDSVEFRLSIEYGETPWYCTLKHGTDPFVQFGPIYGRDTILKGTQEGRYEFSVTNQYNCGSRPAANKAKTIFFRKSGFVRLKVLLEGAYIDPNLDPTCLMHTKLQGHKVIPNLPLVIKDPIVDWITVETRDKIDGETFSCDTFLLRNDGIVIDKTGNDSLEIENTTKLLGDGVMYVVIKHRNHISIMSKDKVKFVEHSNKKDIVTLDMTQEGSVYIRVDDLYPNLDNHAQKLGDRIWGMAAGYNIVNTDESAYGKKNHLISISNPNRAKKAKESEIQGDWPKYLERDVNLDGIVEWPDDLKPGEDVLDKKNEALYKNRDAWLLQKNRNKYSAVPNGK